MYVCARVCRSAHVEAIESQFSPFTQDQIQASFGGKCLYPLSQLACTGGCNFRFLFYFFFFVASLRLNRVESCVAVLKAQGFYRGQGPAYVLFGLIGSLSFVFPACSVLGDRPVWITAAGSGAGWLHLTGVPCEIGGTW